MENRHIDEFLKDTIDSSYRWLHIISGTVPVMQNRLGVKRFDCERLLSNEVYQIADSFLGSEAKKKVLEGKDVIVSHNFSPRYSARLHVYRQRGTLGISGKLIETKVLDLKDINFPEALIDSWLNKKSGLYLISGTPDSGRSTTVNAILNYLGKNNSFSMVQIDDVLEGEFLEFESSLLSRRTINLDVLDFERTIKSLMQTDCNVLALGELNSFDKLVGACQLASRGILVFGTFLALDIENALYKLTQVLAQSQELKSLLSTSLKGIYSQSFFISAINEYHFISEALTMHNQAKKHFKEANMQALLAFLRTGSKKDCIPYARAFENLVSLKKIETAEIPLKHRV